MGRLTVKVVPGSSRDQIVGWLGDALKIKVAAPPEKGKANAAVIALLAGRLGIDADAITVESGHSSPLKVLAVDGLDDDAIGARVGRGSSTAGRSPQNQGTPTSIPSPRRPHR